MNNYKYFKFVLDKVKTESENTQLDARQYRIAMSLMQRGPLMKVIKVNILIFFYTQMTSKFQCNIIYNVCNYATFLYYIRKK